MRQLRYTGKDHRILVLLDKLLDAAGRRDARASDPRKTAAISDRRLFFPPENAVLHDAFILISDHVNALKHAGMP